MADMRISLRNIIANIGRIRQVLLESGWIGGVLRMVASIGGGTLHRRLLASPNFYRFVSHRTAALISLNEGSRDLYRGQIAFVVATGPSVAEQDLSSLRGHIVISVNENFSYLPLRGISVTYNVLEDDAYFCNSCNYAMFWHDLAEAAHHDGIKLVLPALAESRVLADAAWRGIQPNYFFRVGDFLIATEHGRSVAIDFTRPLPGLLTVTHTAVAWAIYLGCTEIHVLGVDLDYADDFSTPIHHCYGGNRYSDLDQLSTAEAFERYSCMHWTELRSHMELQRAAFDRLGEIGRQRGQSIIDASLHGRVGGLLKLPLPRDRRRSAPLASG